jgi:hypothetical protein
METPTVSLVPTTTYAEQVCRIIDGSGKFLPKTVLTFYLLPEDKENQLKEAPTLLDKIKLCLDFAMQYPSVDPTGWIETTAGRKRSSLDLYRHIYKYCPEFTLWDVMHTLYEHADEFYSAYCFGVCKRVCQTLPNMKKLYDYTGGSAIYNPERDEYGLDFDKWKEI